MNYSPDPIPGILAEIARLELSLYELKLTVCNLSEYSSEKIAELESLASPYSSCGQAICNHYCEDNYGD